MSVVSDKNSLHPIPAAVHCMKACSILQLLPAGAVAAPGGFRCGPWKAIGAPKRLPVPSAKRW